MRPSTKNGLKWLLVIGGIYTLATCATGMYLGYSYHGYRKAGQEEETRKNELCYQALEPIRIRFQDECAKKNINTVYDGTLDLIVKKSEQIQQENNCSRRMVAWCEPDSPENSHTPFRAKFTYDEK